MRIPEPKYITLIPITLMVFTFLESSRHFSKNGCDGGTCSLFLLSYSAPLVIAWLSSIGGTFLILRNNILSIFFGIFLLFVSVKIFSSIDVSGIKELNLALKIGINVNYLLIFSGFLLGIFKYRKA